MKESEQMEVGIPTNWVFQRTVLNCAGTGMLAQPALYSAQKLGLLMCYHREGEHFPLPHGKARAAPKGLLRSEPCQEMAQI